MIERPEGENCVGCEYHSRCAGIVFGHIGAFPPPVESGDGERKWCHNWREFDKQKRKEEGKK